MRYRIEVKGVVQGVGFRPFIKRIADRLSLTGTVANTGAGVVIEIETADPALALAFRDVLRSEAPRASHIERVIFGQLPEASAHPAHFLTPLLRGSRNPASCFLTRLRENRRADRDRQRGRGA